MIQNRLLHTFLTDKKINNLYLDYMGNPSPDKKEEIEKLFQTHVYKVQLLTYFSKILHFESQRFDKKIRHLHTTQPLILDKNMDDGETTLLDLIGETQTSYEYRSLGSTLTDPNNLTSLFDDKLLHDIISKLSAKQKEILYLLYIEGIPEIEIAHKLAITKQAVNKTKNQTLKKIRKNYQQGES